MALGGIQVFTGMTVSVVEKMQGGHFLDALFDEITWWIILAGGAHGHSGRGQRRPACRWCCASAD